MPFLKKRNGMKKICLLLCSLFFAACNSTDPSPNPSIRPGTYEGIFSITYFVGTDSASIVQSQTIFTFNDTGRYTCDGDVRYTPPTGGGEYHVIDDSLLLKDLVPHTTEFDWSLILNGTFSIEQSGDTLILAQVDRSRSRDRHIVMNLVLPSMRNGLKQN
jgi:hypothetical protein